MSVFVNAGASQIVATTLFGSGAPLWVALGTALVVNARMFIYSTSIAPVLSEAPGWLRPLLGHMLVDQNYASTMTRGRFRDDVDVIPYYVGAWLALASVWQVSNLAGALLGPLIPASWGLDFAVPLVFLAMLAPTLKDSTAVGVAHRHRRRGRGPRPACCRCRAGSSPRSPRAWCYGAWRDRSRPGETPLGSEEETRRSSRPRPPRERTPREPARPVLGPHRRPRPRHVGHAQPADHAARPRPPPALARAAAAPRARRGADRARRAGRALYARGRRLQPGPGPDRRRGPGARSSPCARRTCSRRSPWA